MGDLSVQFPASVLARVRVPGPGTNVYKDECVFSFDTPETETGLYVCLQTFWGLGRDFVEKYHQKTGNTLFLHYRRIKSKIPNEVKNDGPEKKVTRLAIGVEGGFDSEMDKFDIKETYHLVILPSFQTIPLPNDQLPIQIRNSVNGITTAESARRLAELEAMAGTWDGEVRRVTKHANTLTQIDNGKKIPPSGWKCEAEGCELTENLWLNLTDGSILCGRKYADGSGGNNHAVEYYEQKKYPLAVKLGTITSDGKGDVYSYDEDDMMEDPNLVAHLAHFGINVAVLSKTEKSMNELEIELNQRTTEWNTIQEAGTKLKPLYGPGLTGLVNLGNSCYMNSVMQVCFSIPPIRRVYETNAAKYFDAAGDPVNDFNVQMSKLCLGLFSGKYSQKDDGDESREGITPFMFRHLIGRGHREFSTKNQQDAQEFFLHLVNVVERHFRNETPPTDVFKFVVEDKVVCDETKMVRYQHRVECCLPLSIPLHLSTNLEAMREINRQIEEAKANNVKYPVEKLIKPIVTPEACLSAFVGQEELKDFYSSGSKKIGKASKFTRLATFPDYLVIQLKKFEFAPDWTPTKLDVICDMPHELDLSSLRAKGLQPHEVQLPEESAKPKAVPSVNETHVQQIMEIGFSSNAARRALINTGNSGSDAAMNWLMEHVEDPDLNSPIQMEDSESDSIFIPDEEGITHFESMGFPRAHAIKALKATDNNVQRAVDWIFSHQAELNEPDVSAAAGGNKPNGNKPAIPQCKDGSEKYKLLGFVSHMGTSTHVGHYVCHILKDGHWAIFNDSKVAESENLPKDQGYLYFYQRI